MNDPSRIHPTTAAEANEAMNRPLPGARASARPEVVERLHDRIERDFTYHAPSADQVPKYNEVRDTARSFAHRLADLVPPGRELSLALTKLEEAVHAANAGIARGGLDETKL